MNNEILGMIDRLTDPAKNFMVNVKEQCQQYQKHLSTMKEKADQKYRKSLAKMASLAMVAVAAASVLAYVYQKNKN